MALSAVDIANMALRELPARTISSLDPVSDQSQSAIECAAAYPLVVSEILEADRYDFSVARVALAVVANDRAREWPFAYALPGNVADPLRLLPFGADYGPVCWDFSGNDPFRLPYAISGNILYASEPSAVLEYQRADVQAAEFPALLARAVALELAARICMPILKSEGREKTLMGKAELARQRAQADNLNRQPRVDTEYVSMEEAARNGGYAVVGRRRDYVGVQIPTPEIIMLPGETIYVEDDWEATEW